MGWSSRWRAALTRYAVAACVNVALLGPLPLPRLPRPIPIVAVAADDAARETIQRRRGGRRERWLVTRPLALTERHHLN